MVQLAFIFLSREVAENILKYLGTQVEQPAIFKRMGYTKNCRMQEKGGGDLLPEMQAWNLLSFAVWSELNQGHFSQAKRNVLGGGKQVVARYRLNWFINCTMNFHKKLQMNNLMTLLACCEWYNEAGCHNRIRDGRQKYDQAWILFFELFCILPRQISGWLEVYKYSWQWGWARPWTCFNSRLALSWLAGSHVLALATSSALLCQALDAFGSCCSERGVAICLPGE